MYANGKFITKTIKDVVDGVQIGELKVSGEETADGPVLSYTYTLLEAT